MAKDLDQLTPVSNAVGNYGIFEPDNAWDGASTSVTLYVLTIGDTYLQIGWDDEAPDALHIRSRRRDYMEWSDWLAVAAPEPPEPPDEVTPTPAPPPIISSLNPNEAVVGSTDFTMLVLGQNFDAGSVIVFNGGDEATTFVSATELSTGVKPSLASGAATVPVLVRNADGQQSAARNFTFTAAAPPEE